MRYIIGIGNWCMADDGIGPRLVEHIASNDLERGFVAVNIADDGLRLLSYLGRETEKIVLIDAVDLGLTPGEYRLFRPADVESKKEMTGLTTHEGDILKVLEMARNLGQEIPAVAILGIQPGRLEPAVELSPALRERFDTYLQVAIEEVRKND